VRCAAPAAKLLPSAQNPARWMHGGKVAIGDTERPVGCGERNVAAYGKLAVDLTIDAYAGQAALFRLNRNSVPIASIA